MAKMYPSKLNRDITENPLRSAEVKVYNLLDKQLDDQHHVFYSSPWLGTKSDGSEIDGEADFIVVHPGKGYISIEVKGGRIAIDSDGNWFSTDRYQIKRKIKNPVEQARKSMHQILQKLKKRKELSNQFIGCTWAVILPHVDSPVGDLRPDMPPEKFGCAPHLESLSIWVDSLFNKIESDQYFQPLGPQGVKVFVDMLSKSIELKVNLQQAINQDLRAIQYKTDEQIQLLREMEDNNRMRISGAAGTGKTILAFEKAMMLAEEGKRILLLCYNRPLSFWLKSMVKDVPQVTASSFHQYCREVAEQAQQNVSNRSPEDLAEHLDQYFSASGFEKYDALILDEAQDFKDEWMVALEMVLKDEKQGILYAFYDNNQKVMSHSDSYLKDLMPASHQLTRNFRNTQKIHNHAIPFYEGKFVRSWGPEGEPVGYHPIKPSQSAEQKLITRISELIQKDKLAPESIAILCPDQETLDELRHASLNRIGPYACTNAEEPKPGKVVIETIRRFKGLESPVVLLVLDHKVSQMSELLYTGVTRAQAVLEIFAPTSCLKIFQDLDPTNSGC